MHDLAVIAKFQLEAGKRDEFLRHVTENAKASVASEPGCQLMNPLILVGLEKA